MADILRFWKAKGIKMCIRDRFTVGLQNYHFKNIESFFNISYETICKLQKPRSVAKMCIRDRC